MSVPIPVEVEVEDELVPDGIKKYKSPKRGNNKLKKAKK
jgi:hypothetical protein